MPFCPMIFARTSCRLSYLKLHQARFLPKALTKKSQRLRSQLPGHPWFFDVFRLSGLSHPKSHPLFRTSLWEGVGSEPISATAGVFPFGTNSITLVCGYGVYWYIYWWTYVDILNLRASLSLSLFSFFKINTFPESTCEGFLPKDICSHYLPT